MSPQFNVVAEAANLSSSQIFVDGHHPTYSAHAAIAGALSGEVTRRLPPPVRTADAAAISIETSVTAHTADYAPALCTHENSARQPAHAWGFIPTFANGSLGHALLRARSRCYTLPSMPSAHITDDGHLTTVAVGKASAARADRKIFAVVPVCGQAKPPLTHRVRCGFGYVGLNAQNGSCWGVVAANGTIRTASSYPSCIEKHWHSQTSRARIVVLVQGRPALPHTAPAVLARGGFAPQLWFRAPPGINTAHGRTATTARVSFCTLDTDAVVLTAGVVYA